MEPTYSKIDDDVLEVVEPKTVRFKSNELKSRLENADKQISFWTDYKSKIEKYIAEASKLGIET
jgi:hypothetical protein